MDVLLLQNLLYLPTFGGANKANRLVLQQLVARGYTCRAVAPMAGVNLDVSPTEFTHFLASRGHEVLRTSSEVIVFDDAGVEVHAVTTPSHLPIYAARLGRERSPDLVLVANHDPGFMMLNAAYEAVGPHRVVCLAHTLSYLPFGPEASVVSTAAARQLRRAADVLAVSEAAATYLREWGDQPSTVLRLPAYGTGPFHHHGDPDRGAVTLINPSEIKGIGMFLHLAERLPDVEFLAVPTWGTSDQDRRALAGVPNVRVMEPVEDVDEIFAQTRVLLMPSVWMETYGMTAIEAMLRAIPVVASDIGGLPEAMLGVPYLLPARATDLWVDTVSRLVADGAHYREISARAAAAASAHVASTGIESVDAYLRNQAGTAAAGPERSGGDLRRRVESLADSRRRLLAEMLAKR